MLISYLAAQVRGKGLIFLPPSLSMVTDFLWSRLLSVYCKREEVEVPGGEGLNRER